MKRVKELAALLSAAILTACSTLGGMAVHAEPANAAVKTAQEGVYCIQVVYNGDGGSFPIQSGTGFFISDTMLLTCEHVVTLDAATVAQVEKEAKEVFGSYSKNNLSAEIMLQSDISVPAAVVLSSEDGDWAVLQLQENIEVQPLVFGESDACENTQSVYAIGYPTVVSNYDTIKEFSRSDITTTGGTITKVTSSGGVDLIQHSAQMSNGNSGGPLVDENGAVIGINHGSIKDDTSESYFYATASEQVLRILDQKRIPYQRAASGLSAAGGNTGTIILIAAGVVFLICLAAVLIAVLGKRRTPAGIPAQPAAPVQPMPSPVQPAVRLFTLTRRTNGERCVIDKPTFLTGKDPTCDYRIEGNHSVSRIHAKFELRDDGCYITDMGSMNGTFVGGSRLAPNAGQLLHNGDIIRLSDEEFEFHG